MPSKSQLPQVKQIMLHSPLGGVVRSNSREEQRIEPSQDGKPATCWNALNVLPYDLIYGRGRVGQRFGIAKKFNQLGSGTNPIQGTLAVNTLNYSNGSNGSGGGGGGSSGNPSSLIPGPPATVPVNTTPGNPTGSGGTTGTTYQIPTGTVTGSQYPYIVMQTFEAVFEFPSGTSAGSTYPGFNIAVSGFNGTHIGMAPYPFTTLINQWNTTVSGITAINVATQGSGYSSGTTITLSGGGGTGATATLTVVGGHITAVTITNHGTGYTSTPGITLGSTGGGTGATFTINLGYNPTAGTVIMQEYDGLDYATVNTQTISTFSNTFTLYYALVFLPGTALANGSWAIYVNQSASALLTILESLATTVQASPGDLNYELTGAYAGGTVPLPPPIPFTLFSGNYMSLYNTVTLSDWQP